MSPRIPNPQTLTMWLAIGILLLVLVIALRLIARSGKQKEPPAPASQPATQAEPDTSATPTAPQSITATATAGPAVTGYDIVSAPGIRIARIKNLEDDLSLGLATSPVRIVGPIPGTGAIGIEVPNERPRMVSLRSLLDSWAFQSTIQIRVVYTDAAITHIMGLSLASGAGALERVGMSVSYL